jgi:tetratricopeptide (TPR) repeat protein
LENDRIRAEFLPEQGGRLYSMQDKATGSELLLRNPVYQPCNLGILNAWFSGGVEWNVAQYGHTFTSNSPVFFAKVVLDNGYEFLRMYDYERVKKIFYQIDFHLPDGSASLYAYVRIINDETAEKPMYWWTNIALPERDNVRVFSCTDEVMFLRPESIGNNVDPVRIFGHAKLPVLPTLPGLDSTYPQNSNYSNEFFFQNPASEQSPWSAASYGDGTLFYERSTQPLRFRKMFCWGSHRGGRKWCEYLSVSGKKSRYIELQAGLTPTQLNGISIGPGERWSYLQAFGQTRLNNPDEAYHEEWNRSKESVAQAVERALSADYVQEAYKRFESYADLVPSEILSTGAGWGSLERRRREKIGAFLPTEGMTFPDSSMGNEQLPWLSLLETGALPKLNPDDIPPSWMIDENWRELLERSVEKNGDNYLSALHLGVMLYENYEFEKGIKVLEKYLNLRESPWTLRNLAFAAWRKGESDKAVELMKRSAELENNRIDKAFSEEYLDMLLQSQKYKEAWAYIEKVPERIRNSDRILMQAGAAAVETDNLDFVESMLDREFSSVREGDDILVDMWFKFKTKKTAKERGVPESQELYKEVRSQMTPPENIDFRMVDR